MKVAKKFVLLPIERYNSLTVARTSDRNEKIDHNSPNKNKINLDFEEIQPDLRPNPVPIKSKIKSIKGRKSVTTLGKNDILSEAVTAKPPPGIRLQKEPKKGKGVVKKGKKYSTKFAKIKWRPI